MRWRRSWCCSFAISQFLGETSVGGAGDGNFVAALGRPVLDGLGAVGGGAHARHEHVLLDHVPARTALLAGLLTAYAK